MVKHMHPFAFNRVLYVCVLVGGASVLNPVLPRHTGVAPEIQLPDGTVYLPPFGSWAYDVLWYYFRH